MPRMSLEEAKAECVRWFAYHKAEEDKVVALQRLASDRRRGLCDEREGERRRAEIQGNGVGVYDGSNLVDAVRVLMQHV